MRVMNAHQRSGICLLDTRDLLVILAVRSCLPEQKLVNCRFQSLVATSSDSDRCDSFESSSHKAVVRQRPHLAQTGHSPDFSEWPLSLPSGCRGTSSRAQMHSQSKLGMALFATARMYLAKVTSDLCPVCSRICHGCSPLIAACVQ